MLCVRARVCAVKNVIGDVRDNFNTVVNAGQLGHSIAKKWFFPRYVEVDEKISYVACGYHHTIAITGT